MQRLLCTLPQVAASASNQTLFFDPSFATQLASEQDAAPCAGSVRLMRRLKDKDRNRFALSGKLSDVCAALDALAAQEAHSTWRIAAQ